MAARSITTVQAPGSAVRVLTPEVASPPEKVLARFSLDDRLLLAQLLSTPAEYIDHASFAQSSTERLLFGRIARLTGEQTRFSDARAAGGRSGGSRNEGGLPAEYEARLFQRYNYCRYRVYSILAAFAGKTLPEKDARHLIAWSHRALLARSEIVDANIPLVLAMAKRSRLGGIDFGELVSEGNMALLRSADKFDFARGYKFSTYACRAILKSFSRVAMRTSRYRGHFPTEFDPMLEKSDLVEQRRDDLITDCVSELREILHRNLADLSDVEQTVIRERFAIDPAAGAVEPVPKTLEQVGALIGVTKERVRQIQNKALRKIKTALEEGILAA